MIGKVINVMIVDDHQMFIDGIRSLLRKEKKIAIVAEAHNGIEALNIIKNDQPDILITDINMPEMSGIELVKKVKQDFPGLKTLVLTMYNDREIISEIIMSEAEGYILKNTGKEELVYAINRIADSGTYFCNEVVTVMRSNVIKEKAPIKTTEDLSSRELEILKLICEEFSSAEIAEKLFISPHTVDTHRKNILHKTKSKTIVGLIRFAFENNLVD